ncbi:unnamed protein product [Haemonchus placei]|uniref:Uncharacterized protein n=1 Tax=Haemonchus placei TaxID=6290 RepID=A0A0N4X8M1_HAEPC|nr:unnamed protein product [Haemonchus placei]
MGPITIKPSSGEDVERYVALFTCLLTRLVHLEAAMDLSAKSFIFSGNDLSLEEESEPQRRQPLPLFLAEHRKTWNFIKPSSPRVGGVWERMIGTVKRSTQKTVGRTSSCYTL